jgi:hypothetical protein
MSIFDSLSAGISNVAAGVLGIMPDPSETLYSNGGGQANTNPSGAAADASSQNSGGMFSWLDDLASQTYAAATYGVTQSGQDLNNVLQSGYNEVGNAASGIASTVTSAADNLMQIPKNVFSSVQSGISNIGTAIQSGLNTLTDIPGSVLEGVAQTANDAVSFIEIAIIGVIVAVIVFSANMGKVKLPRTVHVKAMPIPV